MIGQDITKEKFIKGEYSSVSINGSTYNFKDSEHKKIIKNHWKVKGDLDDYMIENIEKNIKIRKCFQNYSKLSDDYIALEFVENHAYCQIYITYSVLSYVTSPSDRYYGKNGMIIYKPGTGKTENA